MEYPNLKSDAYLCKRTPLPYLCIGNDFMHFLYNIFSIDIIVCVWLHLCILPKEIADEYKSKVIDTSIFIFRKKLKCTSKYIYETLFLRGEGSDITIIALGKTWLLHKVYLCQVCQQHIFLILLYNYDYFRMHTLIYWL